MKIHSPMQTGFSRMVSPHPTIQTSEFEQLLPLQFDSLKE